MSETFHPFKSKAARDECLAYYAERAKRWPIPSCDRFVETSFGQTFVRIGGPEDGTPVVLLPGDSENSLSWIPQISALSETYRTYALDQIYDIGRSVCARPVEEPSDFVDWLDELLRALQLDQIVLIGHSYGGWLATLYALAHPERLQKLILIAPASTVLRPSVGLLARALLYYFIPLRVITKRYLYWYAPDSVRRPETRKVIDEMIDEQVVARRCFQRRKFVPPTVLTDEEWRSLGVPTLFLVGDKEVTYSASKAAERLSRVAPQSESGSTAGGCSPATSAPKVASSTR
jgi:pimeloyl-ACP methyl ester carboxylesterase